jgi:hypothetical protein
MVDKQRLHGILCQGRQPPEAGVKGPPSASHLPSGGAAFASTGRGRLLSGFGANARSQGIHQINDPVRGRLLGWLNAPAFLLSAEQFQEGGFIMVDELRGVEMDRLAIHNIGRQGRSIRQP